MDNFEALLEGARKSYLGSHWSVDPDEYNIPPENHKAFLLGAELSCGRFMIISCDSENEFIRDINNYNKAAEATDKFFGKPVVAPYQRYDPDPDEFTAVNPETGERIDLFKDHLIQSGPVND